MLTSGFLVSRVLLFFIINLNSDGKRYQAVFGENSSLFPIMITDTSIKGSNMRQDVRKSPSLGSDNPIASD